MNQEKENNYGKQFPHIKDSAGERQQERQEWAQPVQLANTLSRHLQPGSGKGRLRSLLRKSGRTRRAHLRRRCKSTGERDSSNIDAQHPAIQPASSAVTPAPKWANLDYANQTSPPITSRISGPLAPPLLAAAQARSGTTERKLQRLLGHTVYEGAHQPA